MDDHAFMPVHSKSPEDENKVLQTEGIIARGVDFPQQNNEPSRDEGETSIQKDVVEVVGSNSDSIKCAIVEESCPKEAEIASNEKYVTGKILIEKNLMDGGSLFMTDSRKTAANKESIRLNEEKPSAFMRGTPINISQTSLINEETPSNEKATTARKEDLMTVKEKPIGNRDDFMTKQDETTTNEKNALANVEGAKPHEGRMIHDVETTIKKVKLSKMQEDTTTDENGMKLSTADPTSNQVSSESNPAMLSSISGGENLNRAMKPVSCEMFSDSVEKNNAVCFGGIKQVASDATTSTPFLYYGKREVKDAQSDAMDRTDRDRPTELLKGLLECHSSVFDPLPKVNKFLRWVPLLRGVYSIVCVEQVYFFLRGHSRLLHLAMPHFFPKLKRWLVVCELVLCLLVMASDVFLLAGLFLKPGCLYVWMDIHLLAIVAFVGLMVSLIFVESGAPGEYVLLYSIYIVCFTYFIVIVNALRQSFPLPLEDVELNKV